MPFDPQKYLGIVVRRSVRIFLPRQRKNDARVFLAHRRKSVGAISPGDFNARPLPPKINARSGLHHLIDISSAYSCRAFQKIKLAVFIRLNKLRVRHASHQSQRRNQLAIISRSPASASLPRGTVYVVKTPPPWATFMGGLPYLLTLAKTTSFSETTEST